MVKLFYIKNLVSFYKIKIQRFVKIWRFDIEINLYFTVTSGYQLLSNENDEFSLCMFDQSSFEDKKWQEEVVDVHQVNILVYLPMQLHMLMHILNIERKN